MKKYLYCFCCMALCSPLFCEQSSDEQNELKILDINKRPMSAKIATPEIEHHCYNVVDSLLKPIGLTFDTICPYLRNAIVEIITDTTKKWTAQALRNKQKTVDRYLVTDDITKQVLPLLVNPPDIVNAVNVTIKIDDHFENICLEKDLDIDQIPTEMLPELATLKQQTKTKALVLINRKADRAISCQDLYGIVATTLSNFVERVKYVLILQWASQLVADTEKAKRENPSSSLVHTQETDKLFGSMRFFKKSL